MLQNRKKKQKVGQVQLAAIKVCTSLTQKEKMKIKCLIFGPKEKPKQVQFGFQLSIDRIRKPHKKSSLLLKTNTRHFRTGNLFHRQNIRMEPEQIIGSKN